MQLQSAILIATALLIASICQPRAEEGLVAYKSLTPELALDLARAALRGGLIVEAGGSLVGAVGVSGAPGGDADEACARARSGTCWRKVHVPTEAHV